MWFGFDFSHWICTVVHVSLRAFSLSMRAVLTGCPKVSWLVLGAVVVAFGRCGPSPHLKHYRLALRLPGSTGGLGGAQLSSHPSFDRRPSASGRNLIRSPPFDVHQMEKCRAYFAQAFEHLASASFVFKPLRLLKNVGCLAVIYRRQFLINNVCFPAGVRIPTWGNHGPL